jgi:hypothetical protein
LNPFSYAQGARNAFQNANDVKDSAAGAALNAARITAAPLPVRLTFARSKVPGRPGAWSAATRGSAPYCASSMARAAEKSVMTHPVFVISGRGLALKNEF